jgi:NAD(P)-dependent dehydrogenase (short-subunit alcohol dehydrogenase family)
MNRLDGIEGRVALVTGGARGIGRSIAETLRDLGAEVAAGDLEAPQLPGIAGVQFDVTDENAVDRAFGEVEGTLGAVELVVLNAGIFASQPLEEISLQAWQRMLDVNLTGAFLCARRALGPMRAAGFGRVVAIGSSAGKNGGAKSMAAYAASKAGVMALVKSAALEYAPYGVTVNALAPALIDTEMVAGALTDIADRIPVGRLGRPEEVAAVVSFLCSSSAAFVTGEVVDVNGGFLID